MKKKNKKIKMRKFTVKVMQKISQLYSWFKLDTFCTKIHRSATAPTGLIALIIIIIIKTNIATTDKQKSP